MKQLDPKSVWLFFLGFTWSWLLLVLVFGIYFAIVFAYLEKATAALLKSPIWAGVIIILSLVFFWIWAKLTYHFYRYELREDGFRKESGVIWKKYRTIPYDRIQNVDIYRGVLYRLLGLSELHIQTAGAGVTVSSYGAVRGGAEGRLPGLSREVAEQIRDELIKRSRQSRTTAQGL